MNPFLLTDGYKTGHHLMYPKGTSLVYSNFTPRSNKHAGVGAGNTVVSFGQQMTVRYIREIFNKDFFVHTKEEREILLTDDTRGISKRYLESIKKQKCQEIKKEYSLYLGVNYGVEHIEALWDLGYLPLEIKALPEGTLVPVGVPVLTVKNTKKEFFWLTNFLETLISNLLWKPITSATTAYSYRKSLREFAKMTDEENIGFVDFQGHDFSMRGMDSPFAAMSSGLGHATSFLGSDSLPVIYGARHYYDAEGFVVGSVNATEHAVMCAGTGIYLKRDNEGDWEKYGNAEKEVFKQLLRDFPEGILSVVSDTWDLWKVITEYLRDPEIKEMIMARDGKLVIRPDSGDPVDIICGTFFDTEVIFEELEPDNSPEAKGVIELLWDEYGGTTNAQGFKVLDPHIGAIYGDSITPQRAIQICKRLMAKGFATTNVVLGVGSFTYQFNTRDTWGFAMKATYCEVMEPTGNMFTSNPPQEEMKPVGVEIFKDPITDDGTKKSAKGLLKVDRPKFAHGYGRYFLTDQVSWEEEGEGELKTIFKDGELFNTTTLGEIRERIKEQYRYE